MIGLSVWIGWNCEGLSQTTKVDAESVKPLQRFPRMVQDWLVLQVREAEARGDQRRNRIKSREEALAYVESCKERIRNAFGPLPEKTPLNARVMKKIDRDAYSIECIVFESRPGFLVTGNLYMPIKMPLPMPGVIGVCGHSSNGKAAEAYQGFAQGLARQGYACFIIDPIGQGERFQFLREENKSLYGPGVAEHIQVGNQQTLVGEFLGSWFAWDAIRALDYLLTRPEVDPKRIGVTGNSGGGTQTTWLCGLDDRWTMAAPACFVTTFRRNAENELPADTEQCPPRVLALDLDHSDFLAAMAPKPSMIVAQEKDYFDVRGSQEAHERLRRLYSLLGNSEGTKLHIGPNYHGYSQENREAMYRFFHGITRVSNADKEPELLIEKDETLWCTPEGQVQPMGSKPVFALTRDFSKELGSKRKGLRGEELKAAIHERLKIAKPSSIADFRILRSSGNRKYPTKDSCTYAVETEPGIHAIVTRLSSSSLTSRPPRTQQRAILYLSHRSADRELREEVFVRELLQKEPDSAFFACDVRGIGESQPDCCGVDQFLKPYGSDYFHAAHGLMLDRPVMGQRTLDALRVIDWLVDSGHQEIHLAGAGWGALPATFAGVLHDSVKEVSVKHGLRSYSEIAEQSEYRWPYSVMVPGVLNVFDLPDCYAELGRKKFKNIEEWTAFDGMKELGERR